jgi:tRNA threonylcarbamoyl adenosine modification protein (Sua5/YciO/YrdC/YwlC family)
LNEASGNAVFEVDPARPDLAGEALTAATRALDRGQLVILPTETVYGVASRPDLPTATAMVFEAKRRPSGLNLPVLTQTIEQAWEVARPDGRASALATAFWPGPLTLVLPRSDRSSSWELGDQRDTVAVRVPDHPLTRSLLELTGPLAATSANLSGRPPMDRPDDLVATFGHSVTVYLVLGQSQVTPSGIPSTVVDLTGPKHCVVRAGAIEEVALERALSASGPTR